MDKLEIKSLPLQVDDLSKDKRTAVIAHAAYDNIDLVGDICRPGMFNKSWAEHKSDVKFLIDHDNAQKPGIVTDLFETKSHAMTAVKFGNYTLGNDTLEMLDMGVIDSASFGFKAIKANKLEVKGKKVRELKEVYHGESTLCYGEFPINPETKIVSLTKSFSDLALELKALGGDEQSLLRNLIDGAHSSMEAAVNFSKTVDPKSDLYNWISYFISRQADSIGSMRGQLQWGTRDMKSMKERIVKLEKFCRDSSASDECIQTILLEAKALTDIVSQFDTADTSEIEKPAASAEGNTTVSDEILATLKLLNLKAALS